jgi:hypothetical protein
VVKTDLTFARIGRHRETMATYTKAGSPLITPLENEPRDLRTDPGKEGIVLQTMHSSVLSIRRKDLPDQWRTLRR